MVIYGEDYGISVNGASNENQNTRIIKNKAAKDNFDVVV